MRIVHNILYEIFLWGNSLDTFLDPIYLLAVHGVWPAQGTQRPFSSFSLISNWWVPREKKKVISPYIHGNEFCIPESHPRFHFIQISEVFQYLFITSGSFCPCALSKFHPNALFIYAEAMNSNMKQDKAPKWPTIVIPFPYQDFCLCGAVSKAF